MDIGKRVVEGFFALVMVVGPGIIVYFRLRPKANEPPKGIGTRIIQLIGLFILVPTVAILALECKLSTEGVGTIIGVITGYALSGVSKAVPSRKNSTGGSQTPVKNTGD